MRAKLLSLNRTGWLLLMMAWPRSWGSFVIILRFTRTLHFQLVFQILRVCGSCLQIQIYTERWM